jgi:probable phosphoglycerate mutase
MPRTSASLFHDDDAPADPAMWVTAHCDGGARGNPGPAGFGAVMTDAGGKVIAELSEFLGHRTNNYAEYSGLLACLQWALDHKQGRLRVVSDSELMVKQIQGKYKVNSPDLRPLWEEARRRIAQLERFEISHALRHKNKDADRLANEAMDRGAGDRGAGSAKATATVSATQKVSAPARAVAGSGEMLRGFTRDGVVHILGGAKLPDGVFVKVIPE